MAWQCVVMLLCRKLGNGDEIELRKHFKKRFAYKTLLNLRTRGDSCVHRGSSCTWIEREGTAAPDTSTNSSWRWEQLCPERESSCVHREEAAMSTGRKHLCPQWGSSCVHREEAAVSTDRKQLRPQRGSSFVHREEAAVFTKEVAVVMYLYRREGAEAPRHK